MEQNKKSFIVYSDWRETFEVMTNEDAGILIKHIFSYVNNENPKSDSVLINAVFSNIKNTLNRDLKKWENQLNQRSEAGKKSAQKRAQTKIDEIQRPLDFRQRNSTDNVNVNDSVNDNVNVNEKNIKNIFIKIENSVWEKLTDEEKQQRIDIIKTEFKNSQEFKNTICQKYSFNVRIYDECQKKFFEMILLNDRFNDTFAELKKYFNNWINKNIDTLNPKNYLYR